jgi:aminoglycoside phosphotransferase (APT) family kinase protein
MEERLRAFLESQIPEATEIMIAALERRPGGASRESWAFDVSWKEHGRELSRKCILRRDPPASLLESDKTDRSFEFRVIKAMESRPVPAPKAYWLDQEGRWLERPSMIMERVSGQPTPLPTYPAAGDPVIRQRLAPQFVEILAHIHQSDWNALGLSFLGTPERGTNAAERQVALWEGTYRTNQLEPVPILDAAFRWLRRNLPSTDQITLVHGDYRSGNYLYDNTGRITAMLDWELSHLGDPMEDLGWACMKFWSGGGLAVGLMPREELYRRYEELTGTSVDHRRVFFYEVLGNAKMATISLTGVKSFCEGKTAHTVLAVVGFLVPRLLEDLASQLPL